MKLVRYLSENELMAFKNGDISNIGCEYVDRKSFKRVNSHKYKKGVKYLHFFFNMKNIKLVRLANFLKQDNYYICEFDIPLLVILPYIGKGRYEDSGYKYDSAEVYEVALPAKKMKLEYLISYEKDFRHSYSDVKAVADLQGRFEISQASYGVKREQKIQKNNDDTDDSEPCM